MPSDRRRAATLATDRGGALPFFNDAVADTLVNIKTTQGQLYSLSLTNTTAATAYLQIFFKPAASVTLGTTVADYVIRLKTNAGTGDVKDISFPVGLGVDNGTGISIAGTTTATGLTAAIISVGATYQ